MCLQVDLSYCAGGGVKTYSSIDTMDTHPFVPDIHIPLSSTWKSCYKEIINCVLSERGNYIASSGFQQRLLWFSENALCRAILARLSRACAVSSPHVPYYHPRCPRSAALYKRNLTPCCCGHPKKTASVLPLRLDEKAKFLPPGRGLFLVDYEMSRRVFVVMHCHEWRLWLGQGGECVRGWGWLGVKCVRLSLSSRGCVVVIWSWAFSGFLRACEHITSPGMCTNVNFKYFWKLLYWDRMTSRSGDRRNLVSSHWRCYL